jgi:hypothetical protein
MAQFDTRGMIESAAASAGTLAAPARAVPRRLAEAAAQAAEEPVAPGMSPIVLAGAVRIIELALVALIGTAIYAAYVVPLDGGHWGYFSAIAGTSVLAMFAFQIADIYQVQAFRGHEKQYFRLATAWSVVFLVVIGVSFFAKTGEQFSRAWLGSYYAVGLVTLLAFRRLLFVLVRRWTKEGRLTRRTAIVGGGEPGESLIAALRDQRDSDVRVVGMFDDRSDERSPHAAGGARKLGTVDDLVEFARRTRVDLVIFSLPITAEARILQMLKKLWVLPVDIRLSAHCNRLRFRPRSYSYLGTVPVLDVLDRPITDWDVVMKWLFDKIVGGVALVLLAPLMAAVAIAIKLDSKGPVFFKQRRHGHQGRSPRHPGRPLHPQDQPRRAAAAHQRGVQGQPVAGRPAPPRRQPEDRGPPVRRGGRRLFRPPPRQARNDRLGAD